MFTERSKGGRSAMFSPYRRISPAVGNSKPAIIRSRVVLPQPEGPSRVKNSLSRISRSTHFNATGPLSGSP
ncbi:hypothetical protein D3C80_2015400 [compost metagenome]